MENRYLFRGRIPKMYLDWFEGYEIVANGWVTGSICGDNDIHIIVGPTKIKNDNENKISLDYDWAVEVDPETVSQCTGLTADASYRGESEEDRLIFEGDIIQVDHDLYMVKWNNGIFAIYYKGLHGTYWNSGNLYNLKKNIDDLVEIIGNKWDNPELMEG